MDSLSCKFLKLACTAAVSRQSSGHNQKFCPKENPTNASLLCSSSCDQSQNCSFPNKGKFELSFSRHCFLVELQFNSSAIVLMKCSRNSQRRKSAMKILREKRGFSRTAAMLYGFKLRAHSAGLLHSLPKSLSILAIDAFRTLATFTLRITLVYPFRTFRLLKKTLSPARSD